MLAIQFPDRRTRIFLEYRRLRQKTLVPQLHLQRSQASHELGNGSMAPRPAFRL